MPTFPQPLHAFVAEGRFYVYISEGPRLEIRQPFHVSVFGNRQIRQPLQGRRISRLPCFWLASWVHYEIKLNGNDDQLARSRFCLQIYKQVR